MERYYKSEQQTNSRSQKNKSLYDQIYEDKQYTNVEGVVETPIAGSIDIQKIKEIINSREQKSKAREKRVYEEPQIEQNYEEEETKNYDINDVLNKAKGDRNIEDTNYHSLKNIELNILKGLKIKEKYEEEPEEELKELIHTITNTSMLNKLGDKELSLDLLDDLKSNNNTTIIGSSEAIRKVLKEEKVEEPEDEMDDSFYTKSMNLSNDLEGIKGLGSKKTNKILVRMCTILSILVVLGVIVIVILLILKK